MKTKNDLVENLAIVVHKYKDDKEVKDYMQDIYIEKGLIVRTVNSVLKGNTPFLSLSDREIGIWCVYLNKITNENTLLNPTDYYTEYEIQKLKDYYNTDTKNTKTNKIVLHNVVKVKNQYLCPFISNYDIYKYWNNRLLVYNFDSQRDPKIIKHKKDTIVKEANINWNSVTDIAKDIYADVFTANLLAWNIRKISNFAQQGVVYDEVEKTLTITPSYEDGKEVYVDIMDGFHRTLGTLDAVERANEDGKELEYGFMLSITNFTVREAQDFIRREDKRNPIDAEYSKSLEKDEYSMFVDTLNVAYDSITNKMKDKIGSTLEDMKHFKKYTTINILHDAFRLSNLRFNESYANNKYLEHFVYIFNTILGHYMYKYKNDIEKIKKETVVLEPNAFVGYVAIGRKLLEIDGKEAFLTEMLETNEIDLDRNKMDWASLDMFKKNPKTYKKIYDYFDNVL